MTIDLTNRCNMMCDPCFMDANQVGFVHELSWDEVKRILDDTINVKPRRQMSIQFSGGEPTLSPHFLDAIRYAREVGYFAVQCATNGLRFAREPGFAKQAKEAGLRMAYLQFDGPLGWLADRTVMTPTLTRLVMAARAPHRRVSHHLDNHPGGRMPINLPSMT